MSGTLYIVATPIGNLQDISQRAADTLRAVDFIAAEDTRVTTKLLQYLDIRKPLISYYEHTIRERGEKILKRIENGEDCALVCDAGTPAISDPGEDLSRICAAAGIRIVPIPGPSAIVTALSASGMITGRFTFEGFLSTSNKSRTQHLESLRHEERTMVFYEAPHKLCATLKDLYETFGERRICIGRELTKIHEEFLRMTLSEAIAHFEAVPPRGEFVLIVEGAPPEQKKEAADVIGLVKLRMDKGASLSDAVREVAKETGVARSSLYKTALKELQ